MEVSKDSQVTCMSIRDYFAIQLAWKPDIGRQGKGFLEARAKEAYAYADAMLKVRIEGETE